MRQENIRDRYSTPSLNSALFTFIWSNKMWTSPRYVKFSSEETPLYFSDLYKILNTFVTFVTFLGLCPPLIYSGQKV